VLHEQMFEVHRSGTASTSASGDEKSKTTMYLYFMARNDDSVQVCVSSNNHKH